VRRADYVGRLGFDAEDVARRAIEGAGFPYSAPERIPHTLRALALTELARDRGLHDPVHRRLEAAYWSEGRDIGDDGVLLDLAGEVGLDRTEAAAALESPEYAQRVLDSTLEAQRHGIRGIPAFVLGGRFLVMGAQPHGILEEAMTMLETETEV
jgi:protein disulfide-isomerase